MHAECDENWFAPIDYSFDTASSNLTISPNFGSPDSVLNCMQTGSELSLVQYNQHGRDTRPSRSIHPQVANLTGTEKEPWNMICFNNSCSRGQRLKEEPRETDLNWPRAYGGSVGE
jgi:hypothetical protein